MNVEDAKKLRAGARVRWCDGRVAGVVSDTNWMTVKIAWEDGIVSHFRFESMGDVELDVPSDSL